MDSIGQIAINVQDLERATAFYRDTLGIRFLFEASGMAFFDCGGVRLMLSKAEKGEFDHPASVIYYKVADINGECTALKSLGVRFEREPHLIARMPDHELWMAFVRDSENNLLGIMSEVRGQA